MKDVIKWSIIAVILIAVVSGAAVLYDRLGKDYNRENLTQQEEQDFSAPDFTVLDYNGKEVSLSDFAGTPVVLNFWATWCGFCKEEMPDFDKAYKNYPDVKFLMINATDGVRETMDKAKKYVEENGFEFDVVFDTEMDAVRAYYVNSFPTTFFINAQGQLVTYGSGRLDYKTLEKGIGMITK